MPPRRRVCPPRGSANPERGRGATPSGSHPPHRGSGRPRTSRCSTPTPRRAPRSDAAVRPWRRPRRSRCRRSRRSRGGSRGASSGRLRPGRGRAGPGRVGAGSWQSRRRMRSPLVTATVDPSGLTSRPPSSLCGEEQVVGWREQPAGVHVKGAHRLLPLHRDVEAAAVRAERDGGVLRNGQAEDRPGRVRQVPDGGRAEPGPVPGVGVVVLHHGGEPAAVVAVLHGVLDRRSPGPSRPAGAARGCPSGRS